MKKKASLFGWLLLALTLGFSPVLADDEGFIMYQAGGCGSGIPEGAMVANIVQVTIYEGSDQAQCWGAYPWSADGEWIVYQSNRGNGSREDSANEICKMKADGTGWVQLTDDSLCDSHPSFTPDGLKVVYQHEDELTGEPRIYIMNADGTGQTDLSAVSGTVAGHQKPVVSPDGTKIAFRKQSSIWVMDIDGTGPGTIPIPVMVSGALHGSTKHTWSPDSQWILFNGSTTEGCEEREDEDLSGQRIYKVKYDGSSLTMLSDNSVSYTVYGDTYTAVDKCDNWAFWSPDGQYIAYHSNYDSDSIDFDYDFTTLSIMNADGSNKRHLVFVGEDQQVELVPLNGGMTLAPVAELTRVSDAWYWVCGPKSWSPDSQWIAFKMWNQNYSAVEIFAYNVATDEVRQLTTGFQDYRLWWSPDGKKILFRDYGGITRDGSANGNDLLVINLAPGFLNSDTVDDQVTEGFNSDTTIESSDVDSSVDVTVGTQAGDTATITLTKLSDNPVGVAFNGSFYDLFLSDPGQNVTQIIYRIYFNGTATTPYWFDDGAWVEVSDYEVVDGPFVAPFDTYDGCIEITIDDTTTPSLSDLGGTVFGLGEEPEEEEDDDDGDDDTCFINSLFRK